MSRSLPAVLRQSFFLLLMLAALPSLSWAIDTDGDGVDDSVDAFPNKIEASVDTDGDGMPNSFTIPVPEQFNGTTLDASWQRSGSWRLYLGRLEFSSLYPVSIWKIVNTGAYISFAWSKGSVSDSTFSFYVDGILQSCPSSPCSVSITPGMHELKWSGKVGFCGTGFGCSIATPPWVDNINFGFVPSLTEDVDDDNDGVLDTADQCPLIPTCSQDADGDGIDNSVEVDDDNDGVLDGADNCPLTTNADQLNTDGDVQGNACDMDDDNDGVADTTDKFPLNAAASSDTDNDGFPGSWNAACDATCQAASGLVLDNCPSTANADQLNTDGDAQGNACDSDDDNDGLADTADVFPLDNTQAGDMDADGVDGFVDNCPSNANADQLNTDGDTQGNVCDSDDDNDGVADGSDKFPLNAAASSDTDNDGYPGSWSAGCDATCQAGSGLVLDNCPANANADQLNTDGDSQGNACDTDDDNDGVLDTADVFPLDNTQAGDIDADGVDGFVDNCPANANVDQLNTDGDMQGNACDSDDDNDGVTDAPDKFPLNPAASSDTDNDGYPGSWNGSCNATCQANSGLTLDNCPSNANADQLNTDGDTQGNACDSDDDNDGVSDGSDALPLNAAESLDTDADGTGNNADLDDDGDGVPDYIDADVLNSATASERVLPVNGSYKGSQVRDRVSVP